MFFLYKRKSFVKQGSFTRNILYIKFKEIKCRVRTVYSNNTTVVMNALK